MHSLRFALPFGLCALTTTAYAAPCSVPAAMQPAAAAGLRAVSDLWLQALATRNQELLNCILSDDYLDTNWRGDLRTKPMMLQSLTGTPSMKQNVQIEKLHIIGDIGLIWGINRVTDPFGASLATLRFKDVYRYQHRHWYAIASQETLVQHKTR